MRWYTLASLATVTMPARGAPEPLGVSWDGHGVNVAVVSRSAEDVEICLLPDPAATAALDPRARRRAAAASARRFPLIRGAGHVWHAYLPGVGPGQRYGFRVRGEYDPARGRYADPAKLLVDPYARALHGTWSASPALWAAPGDPEHADTAGLAPVSVVVDENFDWGNDAPPAHPWSRTLIYEAHVAGLTRLHPGVSPADRGTYLGLGNPQVIDHLLRLGVTAVELLPVHAFVSEPALRARGLENYWGYNTLGYFAPHAGYARAASPGAAVTEFKTMVAALHAAGLEVLLDVVYNHTAELDEDGPCLSLRGLDNLDYYLVDPTDPGHYRNLTGCGNTVAANQPPGLRLILDSLRYWVASMHVDGFRFDLAGALGRFPDGFDPRAPLLQAITADPLLRTVKLIAEPWDATAEGYAQGRLPHAFAEWNGRFRDTVRDYWRAGRPPADLATRFAGSADYFAAAGRATWASINFVTAHDGFTLADLVSYSAKHNDANGAGGTDGTDENFSDNCGVEGPCADPGVLRRRSARRRALLASVLLAAGTPMLRAGDEFGATQAGNNNAYCQDSPLSWVPWPSGHETEPAGADAAHPDPAGADPAGADPAGADPAGADPELVGLIAGLAHLRRMHPGLRQPAHFTGHPAPGGTVADLAWYAADGAEMSADDWSDAHGRALTAWFAGGPLREPNAAGDPKQDSGFLVVLHPGSAPAPVVLPGGADRRWRLICDTCAPDPFRPPAPEPARPAPGPAASPGRQPTRAGRARPRALHGGSAYWLPGQAVWVLEELLGDGGRTPAPGPASAGPPPVGPASAGPRRGSPFLHTQRN